MAILERTIISECPRCGSMEVKVGHRKIHSSKASIITKKYIKCNSCGFEG